MNPSHLQSSPKITPWLIIHQFFPIQPLSPVDQALSINEWCVITPTANIKFISTLYQPLKLHHRASEFPSSQKRLTESNNGARLSAMARLDPQPPSQPPSPPTVQIQAAKFLDCTGVMMGSVRGCVSSICTRASASP